MPNPKIVVVIPAYRVKAQIASVLSRMRGLDEIAEIIVVDDKCPEGSGQWVQKNATDHRIRVLFNEVNEGVGGATMAGIKEALRGGADIIVKVDGDGQMDPLLVPALVAPLVYGQADYVKGNRFFFLSGSRQMPKSRLFGNLALSFLAKLSTGYWGVDCRQELTRDCH